MQLVIPASTAREYGLEMQGGREGHTTARFGPGELLRLRGRSREGDPPTPSSSTGLRPIILGVSAEELWGRSAGSRHTGVDGTCPSARQIFRPADSGWIIHVADQFM